MGLLFLIKALFIKTLIMKYQMLLRVNTQWLIFERVNKITEV